jgi:starvation-inducible DNA-binding protein
MLDGVGAVRRPCGWEEAVDVHVVADDLQCLLAEVIDLSLTSKQAHWILGRSRFDPLSAELADLAAEAWGWADAVGARLAVMGVPPDGRAGTVAEQVRFPRFPDGFIEHGDAVAPIVLRMNEIIEECPRRIESLSEADPVSEDILICVVVGLVKHRWVLVSQESGEPSPWDVAARRPGSVRG